MAEYRVKRPLQRSSIHPGEGLRGDMLLALGLSVSETARRLGVSLQLLYRILACTHLMAAEMALRIGKLIGNGPGLWLRMQQNHDLRRLEQALKSALKKIETTETTLPDPAVSLDAGNNPR